MNTVVDPAFLKMLENYRLTTAEILYHMPDHPDLLQSFIWQDFDVGPHYPVLHGFLDFWTASLDGPLHSVRIMGSRLIHSSEIRNVQSIQLLH